MTPTRWQQIDQLLEAALELPADKRAVFLENSCNGDETLRREVEQLLAADESSDDFLEVAPAEAMAEVLDAKLSQSLAGSRVGPYQILRELGRGGMGIVCLAERTDQQYRQQVAIKLLWPGVNQTEIVRRFRRERQILANLHHPNIAQLFDGGTTEDGRPYFVMEHVTGQPITEYCRTRQLIATERLTLFQQVCSAVQYAHQNLIIHRDLKPGNILVTEDGTVKLLDFGIAKLLDPARHGVTAQPTTSALLMTPEYASPEQMRGQPVNTASDVYSLGIVLYELLTGQLPYYLKGRTLPEFVRAVCEEEPLPPGKLNPTLRGDLEVITMTALSKEAATRYASVEQLSAEVRRHLELQPILTRKPTWRYRAGKFVRRNRLGVFAASALVLALLAGVLATLWQARIAIRERTRAEAHAEEANHQRNFAEAQAAEAIKQQGLAEASKTRAESLSVVAEQQTAVATQQQLLAESERNRAQESAAAYRQLAYYSQMHNGAEQWELANLVALRQTLANQLPKAGESDLRGFEWRYLWRLLHHNAELKSIQEEAQVWSAQFSPDGKLIATANYGKEDDAKLWDVATGKQLGRFKGHKNLIYHTAFSPDGNKLITASYDGTAKLWEVHAQKEILTFKGHTARISQVVFSPTGSMAATASDDNTVRLWEVATGNQIRVLQREQKRAIFKSLAFSPDGKLLAVGGIDAAQLAIFDVATGRELRSDTTNAPTIWSVAFGPDGKRIATGHGDNLVRLWDAASLRLLAQFSGHTGAVRSVAFSPDGRYLVSGSTDRTVRLWEAETGLALSVLKGHQAEIWSVAYSPDGATLLTGSMDFTAKLWDAQSAIELSRLNVSGTKPAFAYSPDGARLATDEAGSGNVLIRAASNGRILARCLGHVGGILSLSFAPDGNRLASVGSDNLIRIWDSATGRALLEINDDLRKGNFRGMFSVAFSPDGRKLVVTGNERIGSVTAPLQSRSKVWNALTGQPLFTLSEDPNAAAAVFSPDGKWIATAGQNIEESPAGRIWDASTGRLLVALTGHKMPLWSVAFSPDSKLLATASADTTVKIWEVGTWREVTTLTGIGGHVNTVAFSPNGSRLATGSGDNLVRLWDVATWQETVLLKGHTAAVTRVAFSPDGQTLTSSSGDRTIRFWRAANASEIIAASKK